MNNKLNLKKVILMGIIIAIGVVISPMLRFQGFCPTQHFINVIAAVFLGPLYAFICAVLIGVIRMSLMAVTPLALTGAVFGALLSGILYKVSGKKIILAVIGEVVGTGIIGSMISFPVMKFIMGSEKVSLFYYTPLFISATLMGGFTAYIFLIALKKNHTLDKLQRKLDE